MNIVLVFLSTMVAVGLMLYGTLISPAVMHPEWVTVIVQIVGGVILLFCVGAFSGEVSLLNHWWSWCGLMVAYAVAGVMLPSQVFGFFAAFMFIGALVFTPFALVAEASIGFAYSGDDMPATTVFAFVLAVATILVKAFALPLGMFEPLMLGAFVVSVGFTLFGTVYCTRIGACTFHVTPWSTTYYLLQVVAFGIFAAGYVAGVALGELLLEWGSLLVGAVWVVTKLFDGLYYLDTRAP